MEDKYKKLWDRLYNWLNDMRYNIAPDEFVTDDADRNDRLVQMELIDALIEWMEDVDMEEPDGV